MSKVLRWGLDCLLNGDLYERSILSSGIVHTTSFDTLDFKFRGPIYSPN